MISIVENVMQWLQPFSNYGADFYAFCVLPTAGISYNHRFRGKSKQGIQLYVELEKQFGDTLHRVFFWNGDKAEYNQKDS